MEQGIKVTVEEDIRWKFCHIKSLNLLPNIMIKNKINEQGYQEAILVRDGIVTEGCHSNFFMVKNNKLITHPADNFILHGITRHYVITLAKSYILKSKKENFHFKKYMRPMSASSQRHHLKYSQSFKLVTSSSETEKEGNYKETPSCI